MFAHRQLYCIFLFKQKCALQGCLYIKNVIKQTLTYSGFPVDSVYVLLERIPVLEHKWGTECYEAKGASLFANIHSILNGGACTMELLHHFQGNGNVQ